MVSVTATELRKHFEAYLDRANAGEEFLVTRWGRPWIRLMPMDGGRPPAQAPAKPPVPCARRNAR